MKSLKFVYGIGLLSLIPTLSFAQPTTRYYGKPLTSQNQRFPIYAGPYQGAAPRPTSPSSVQPPHHRPPSYRPPPHHRPPYGGYPIRPGVSIIYRAPSYSNYSEESNSYVYGDANSSIESRDYVLITDWRRLGLPDPPEGMHWIYENGRYVLEPNSP